MHVCARVCKYACTCVCILCVCVHVCICTCVCTCVCVGTPSPSQVLYQRAFPQPFLSLTGGPMAGDLRAGRRSHWEEPWPTEGPTGEQSPPGSPQPSECVFKVVNSALNHGVYVAINQEVIRFCSIYLVAQVEKKGWPFPLKTQASSLWLVLRLGPQSTRQPWKAHSLRVQVQWQHPANAPGMGMKRALGERGLSSSYWNPH